MDAKTFDTVNASFQAGAFISCFLNLYTLIRIGRVSGINLVSCVFYSSWNIWGVYYYIHQWQPVSLMVQLCAATVNVVYYAMVINYSFRPRSTDLAQSAA